ncbi:MAG: tRNA pseudouridine(38-40) synthase TruA [Enterocloster sp.]
MKRVRMVVAYDGTGYHGWQLQPGAVTVEQVLNEKLSELLGESIEVIGASRTDSGVHARGNVAVFDTEHRMPADKICPALNQRLPEDIRIQSSEEVPADWHPRKCSCVKTYEYKILNRRTELPMERLYSHFCYFKLDMEQMRLAAERLTGEHDFKSFCNVRTQVKDTVRRVYSIQVERDERDMITIRVTGGGFLYNMVRIIAGTLLSVGMGQLKPEDMDRILEARDRSAAGPTAPARGLTLAEIRYDAETIGRTGQVP